MKSEVNNCKIKTILHVDDDKNILDLIKFMLRDNNYRIISEIQGSKAIKLAQKYKPDLIILDIMMPDVNGYELLPQLKNNQETKDIPILILSVSSTRTKSMELGATLHMTKPMNQVKLNKTIHELIHH